LFSITLKTGGDCPFTNSFELKCRLETVNSIIFAATDDVGFLEYKDNLYPKVIFFPLTMGLMYLITAFLFLALPFLTGKWVKSDQNV